MNKVLFFCLILIVVSIDCLTDHDLIGLRKTQLKNETILTFNKTKVNIGKRFEIECSDSGKHLCFRQPDLVRCDNIGFDKTTNWKCKFANKVAKNMTIRNPIVRCLKDNETYTSNPNSTVYLDSCYLSYTLGNGFKSTYLSSGLILLSFISSFLIGSKF